MPTYWPPRFCASFLQLCRERCPGAWNVSAWWMPVIQTFTIQTAIHFICVAVYLLHINHRLLFTDQSLGMPYAVSIPNLSSWAPPLLLLYHLLIRAPLVEELRYRGTVWLRLVAFQQSWAHWILDACTSILSA